MLVDVPPDDTFYAGMPTDQPHQLIAIIESDAVQPLAMDGYRLMVQTNKGMGQCAAFELAIECRQRLGTYTRS